MNTGEHPHLGVLLSNKNKLARYRTRRLNLKGNMPSVKSSDTKVNYWIIPFKAKSIKSKANL
jgi:hypothetical protein